MRAKSFYVAAILSVALVGLSNAQTKQKVDDPATKKKVHDTVERYVKQEGQLKGGFFLRDAQENAVRDLQFDYVHDGVERTEAGQYLVCVDFLDPAQKRLDVDFWLEPTSSGDLQVSKIRIDKVNGVARKAEATPGELRKP